MSTDLHAVLNETSICAKAIKVMVNAFFNKQLSIQPTVCLMIG